MTEAGPTGRTTRALRGLSLPLAACACALISAIRGLQLPINDDDVYNLHSMWCVAHGALPFRDFFAVHLPGLWIVGAPLTWFLKTAGGLFLAGRVLTALIFGASIALAGRIARAGPIGSLLLGFLGIHVLSYCQVYVLRVEYVALLLVLVHLVLLARPSGGRVEPWAQFFAAASLALACTMTVRPVVFLALQPLLILVEKRERGIARRAGLWLAGLFVGGLPCAVYMTIHGLWPEAIFWSLGFPSTTSVGKFHMDLSLPQAILWIIAALALGIFTADKSIERRRRIVLAAGLALAFAFHLINPFKIRYAAVHVLTLASAIAVAAASSLIRRALSILEKKSGATARGLGRLGPPLAVVVFSIWFVGLLPAGLDRGYQQMQIEVLDWLQRVAGDDTVMLIGPHHPIAARDATYIMDGWPYAHWMANPHLKGRLRGAGEMLIRERPAAIATNPWHMITRGMDLLEWLNYNRVIDDAEFERLRAMISSDYVLISFPKLGTQQFGEYFWIRADRIGVAQIPEPHVIQ